MEDLNLDQKVRIYWRKAEEAIAMQDFRAFERAYWGLRHLMYPRGKELPTIKV